ncbi:spore protease YyaC [Bacillus sp. EB106-08-02-XG196]|jgi:putative sporulation protein YyaC|uniref:spore protease YyaC n=1 Tax=Bacillus sp. EB106-08-02-XG196 TaxID=2737049 RepID=UPI0015C420DE|nr:spore protease YyaC [Bacillus sp. EB106-08-02-XG196]NWQ41796.1 spore protease YyaC [Bacillus sp. EB106-08-02-XG196]
MSNLHENGAGIFGDPSDKNTEKLASLMKEIIQSSGYQKEDIIFLCIGSDRSVGDSLGPLVGTMLKEYQVPYRIYGTLEKPVHAFNLKETLKEIKKEFIKPLIISVDACLGDQNQVGYVFLKEGPLVPGEALKKVLPEVGDYHIIGMVNYIDPLPAMQFLNDTRLFTVMNLAKTIVKIITQATNEIQATS